MYFFYIIDLKCSLQQFKYAVSGELVDAADTNCGRASQPRPAAPLPQAAAETASVAVFREFTDAVSGSTETAFVDTADTRPATLLQQLPTAPLPPAATETAFEGAFTGATPETATDATAVAASFSWQAGPRF